jgi:predicted CxxxxCH...CXXCH cytochrome family protein
VHISTYSYACDDCHSGAGDETALHANSIIEISFSATAGTAGQYNDPSNTPGDGFSSCANTYCHGYGSPTWGASIGYQCVRCHGDPQGTLPEHSAPGISVGGAPDGNDNQGQTAATDPQVGADKAHVEATDGISSPIGCTHCHNALPGTVTESGHIDSYGPAEVPMTSMLATNTSAVEYTTDIIYTTPGDPDEAGRCANTYCHNPGLNDPNKPNGTDPIWNDTTYFEPPVSWVDAETKCAVCHGYPPDDSGTHTQAVIDKDCNSCHARVVDPDHYTIDITNAPLHVNGLVEADGSCLSCHGQVQTGNLRLTAGSTTRDVTGGTDGDFTKYTSRHVFGLFPTDYDCIICHSEGDIRLSNDTDGITVTAEHNDAGGINGTSTIAMRNVDKDANPGTNTDNTSIGAWGDDFWRWPTVTDIGNHITPADHSRMDKFCMVCHDSDGAFAVSTNTDGTALDVDMVNGTQWALMPFKDNLRTYNSAAASDDLWSDGTKTWDLSIWITSEAQCITANLWWTNPGGAGLCEAERGKINDVKSKFDTGSYAWEQGDGYIDPAWDGTTYDGNPAQHAVLGPRYSTKDPNWQGWVSVTLKSGQDQAVAGEAAQLHCADCHTVDINSHGGPVDYIVTGATVEDTCYICHMKTVYDPATANDDTEEVARFDHYEADTSLKTAYTKVGSSMCMNCHGGAPQKIGFGGIHGLEPGADYRDSTGNSVMGHRFLGGAFMAHDPQDFTQVDTSTCYFDAATKNIPFTSCGQHSGTKASGSKNAPVLNYGRLTDY